MTTTVQVPTSNTLPVTATNWGDVVTQDLSKAPPNSVLVLVGMALLIAAALFTFLVIMAIVKDNKLAADWVGRASVAIAIALGGGTLLGSQFQGSKK